MFNHSNLPVATAVDSSIVSRNQAIARPAPLSLLEQMFESNLAAINHDPNLEHRSVLVTLYDHGDPERSDDGCGRELDRDQAKLLVVSDAAGAKRFTLRRLPENDIALAHWCFGGLDLSNFVFEGDAYKFSLFANTNLTNADLSNMTMTSVTFDSRVILDNVKFPPNILEPNVLGDDASRKRVIEQLQKTYIKQGGSRRTTWGSMFDDSRNFLEILRERAVNNPGGAAARTLAIHALPVSGVSAIPHYQG